MQDLMLYDPQQRPTASQSLQHIFFQAINTFPAPALNAEQVASTFMKQPYKKSENEMKIEERAMAKKMQEELERGQVFVAPVVNILHETAEPARTNSTYVLGRLEGAPRVGPPTNIQPTSEDLQKGNSSFRPTPAMIAKPSIRSTHLDVDHGDDTLNDLAMLGMLGSPPEHSNNNLNSNQNEFSNKGAGYAPSSASSGSSHRMSNAPDMMTSVSLNQVTGGAVDADMAEGVNKYSKTARYRLNPAGNPTDSGAPFSSNYPSTNQQSAASISKNGSFGVANSGYSSNNYSNMNSAIGYNSTNAKANTIAALNPTAGMNSLNPTTAGLNMPAASSRFGRLAQFGVMGSSSSGTAQTVSGAIPSYSSVNSTNGGGPSAGFGRHKF